MLDLLLRVLVAFEQAPARHQQIGLAALKLSYVINALGRLQNARVRVVVTVRVNVKQTVTTFYLVASCFKADFGLERHVLFVAVTLLLLPFEH